ncbi:MAG: DUF6377 domain-containing protein [Bacteroidales bacterium]|nr:DUF6377 domain-containing protein [Bacteroidales bacterium]MCF8337363.1 DUF6377 domain-containing protein [Bacteroidales bacterium]
MNYESLDQLDEVLKQKEKFVDTKQDKIRTLKKHLENDHELKSHNKFHLWNQLYEQYQSFIYDSAFTYAKKLNKVAYRLDSEKKIAYSKLQLGFTTLSAGMFKETFDTLNTVKIGELPDTAKADYCLVMARALYDISDYNNDIYYAGRYGEKAEKYVERGTDLADHQSYDYLYLNSLYHLRNENDQKALNYLGKLLNGNVKLTLRQNAIAKSTAAFIYLRGKDTTRAINLLAKASISDIKSANKETTAMMNLAELLYNLGNVDKAYKYINHAMDNAQFYGAKQRKVQVGSVMPMITAAYVHDIDKQRRTLLNYLVGIAALSLITIALAIITFYQFRKLRRKDRLVQQMNRDLQITNNKLTEANKIKDEYIGYFFTINSEYLQKVEKFIHALNQRLYQRKFDEMEYLMKRMDLNKERKNLYHSFDEVFLKIFPNFIEEFNSCFEEKEQIKVEEGQPMSTELRIFALYRLGITDSTKIANILGYSVNTIYAYKSRLMNKAILPAEEFRKRIMEIQAK